jgi:hypothetical protein
MMSNVDESFMAPIGKLLTAWSVWESQMNDLISGLLTANGHHAQEWRGLPFKKRYELLREEFDAFASGYHPLIAYMNEARRAVDRHKVLRDSLAHKIMRAGTNEKAEKWIRFKPAAHRGQLSKRYYVGDLNVAASEVAMAAGRIFWLRAFDESLPLPSRDILHLRSIPNAEDPIYARMRGQKLPHVPSRE